MPTLPLDPDRDAWTLPLIPKAIARGMPLFAICRGIQETNVALGGSLHQAVHAVGPMPTIGRRSTRRRRCSTALRTPSTVERGGLLEQLLGERTFDVNSVHGQAVNRLAPGLRVEARAPDGLVEAFSRRVRTRLQLVRAVAPRMARRRPTPCRCSCSKPSARLRAP